MKSKTDFLPAAHYDCLTPLYGGFMRLFFGRSFRRIAEKIKLRPGRKLLDIGCGAGNFLKILHKQYPENELNGLDIDPKILKIARKKLPVSIPLKQASATELPYPDRHFDIATSTLMIHHLSAGQKQRMLNEAYRVLKPGGHFFLMDFAPPTNLLGKLFTTVFRKVENLDDALNGKYKEFMEQAGFKNTHSVYRIYGMIELLKGVK